ncbi:hypothetical protein EHV15_05390 [Paenibacillus oralis]|uniref:Uncharacterized protein n=1 Tax=Paenibacillus oralis TaxID=2490856 RepID=A0A3P3TWE0_9BACL|nr:hypothetical protein [Paenibacillus oralis]RRJ62447.1 hypothetical protein EHV15_05390 [Paenibacillus oralis]
MKVRNLTLINGEIYNLAEIDSPGIALPEEMDAMVAVKTGNTTTYINAAMIMSFEAVVEPQIRAAWTNANPIRKEQSSDPYRR